mmetsp:Transcript_132309/g.282928  ORF Transcript_132309/g.282928 Transcript_132309/m.282928 type:complete len:472 (-) Transcript_132309:3231-4646(-)
MGLLVEVRWHSIVVLESEDELLQVAASVIPKLCASGPDPDTLLHKGVVLTDAARGASLFDWQELALFLRDLQHLQAPPGRPQPTPTNHGRQGPKAAYVGGLLLLKPERPCGRQLLWGRRRRRQEGQGGEIQAFRSDELQCILRWRRRWRREGGHQRQAGPPSSGQRQRGGAARRPRRLKGGQERRRRRQRWGPFFVRGVVRLKLHPQVRRQLLLCHRLREGGPRCLVGVRRLQLQCYLVDLRQLRAVPVPGARAEHVSHPPHQPIRVPRHEPLPVLLLECTLVLPLQGDGHRAAKDTEERVGLRPPKDGARQEADESIQEDVANHLLYHEIGEGGIVEWVHLPTDEDRHRQQEQEQAPRVISLDEVELRRESEVVHALQRLRDTLVHPGVVEEPPCQAIPPSPLGIEHVVVDAHAVGDLSGVVHKDVHQHLERSHNHSEEEIADEITLSDVVHVWNLGLLVEHDDRQDEEW